MWDMCVYAHEATDVEFVAGSCVQICAYMWCCVCAICVCMKTTDVEFAGGNFRDVKLVEIGIVEHDLCFLFLNAQDAHRTHTRTHTQTI